jgi:hypothetical protein
VVLDGGVRRLLSFAEAASDLVFQSVEAHRIDVITDDGVTTMTVTGHLVTASVVSAPAALAVAKLLYPEDGRFRRVAGSERHQ